jgi:hypothetical protein
MVWEYAKEYLARPARQAIAKPEADSPLEPAQEADPAQARLQRLRRRAPNLPRPTVTWKIAFFVDFSFSPSQTLIRFYLSGTRLFAAARGANASLPTSRRILCISGLGTLLG